MMRKRMIAALLSVLALLACAASAAAYDTQQINVDIPYFHVWITDVEGVDDSFVYRWTAETEGAPMPVGSQSDGYYWTLSGNTEGVLTLIFPVNETGEYTYRLAAYVPNPVEGYTYEHRVFYLTLIVKEMPDGTLGAEWYVLDRDSGEKVDRLDLDPRYAEPAKSTDTSMPEKTPEKTTEKETTARKAATPKTGDETRLESLVAIMSVSAVLIVFLLISDRRERREQDRKE